ncbi:MAG: hypothetical protein ABI467_10370, partial [Kofleriaceae bacterium]
SSIVVGNAAVGIGGGSVAGFERTGGSVSLVACSASGDLASASEYDDVAQHVATSIAGPNSGDMTAMMDVVLIGSGDLPLGMSIDADGDVGGAWGGITYNFDITCRDGQGTILATCNSRTQIADVAVDWGGALTLPGFTTSMARHGDWSMIDLQEPSVKLAGNGSFSFDSTIVNPQTRTSTAYHFDYDAAYMAVFIDKTSRLATAGEVQYDITAENTADGQAPRSFAIHADVTFNGDGTATAVLDDTYRYSIDLTTGRVAKL